MITPYYKSKIRAEKLAWEFVDSLPEKEKFELVSINPGGVFGPLLIKSDGASVKSIVDVLTGKLPSIPRIGLQFCDVRDVADAHVAALTCKSGERIAITENTYMLHEITRIVYDLFGQYGYNITYKPMWTSTMWLASWFLKDAKSFYAMWDVKAVVSNEKSKKLLKLKYRDAKDTMNDMVLSLIKHGFVPDRIHS